MFKMNKMELENLNKKMLASIDDRRPDKQYFTLEEYASEFFNVPGETKTKSGVIANMNKKKLIPLWAKVNNTKLDRYSHATQMKCLDTPFNVIVAVSPFVHQHTVWCEAIFGP